LRNKHFKLPDDAKNFARELEAEVPSEKTVLYTTYPAMLFGRPAQRCLIVEAVEMFTAEDLRNRRYGHAPPEGVALLVPAEFADNGKLEAIEASFGETRAWRRAPLPSVPDWGLWLPAPPWKLAAPQTESYRQSPTTPP
jgi:hypothetical protein